jgi:hypothetical protein
VASGEHERLPADWHLGCGGTVEHRPAVAAQVPNGVVVELDPVRSASLGRHDHQAIRALGDRPRDAHGAVAEIDIGPPQAAQLAPASAGRCRQAQVGMQARLVVHQCEQAGHRGGGR